MIMIEDLSESFSFPEEKETEETLQKSLDEFLVGNTR